MLPTTDDTDPLRSRGAGAGSPSCAALGVATEPRRGRRGAGPAAAAVVVAPAAGRSPCCATVVR